MEEVAAMNAVKLSDVYDSVTLEETVPNFVAEQIGNFVYNYRTKDQGETDLNPTAGKQFQIGVDQVIVTTDNVMELQDLAMQQYFLSIDNLEKALDIVAYQGFDPVKFYPYFAEFCGKLQMKCSRVGLMILSAFVMRGTNVRKMQGKSTDEFRTLVKSWVSAGLKQKSNDAKAVTVGRVAALYPQFTCYVNTFAMVNGLKEDPVEKATLPIHLRFTGAPSIMPDAVWSQYEEDYYSYMKEFTKIISRDRVTGKTLDDTEISRRSLTVKAIAIAQRKKTGYHYKMIDKYFNFLLYRGVVGPGFKLAMVRTIGLDSGSPLVEDQLEPVESKVPQNRANRPRVEETTAPLSSSSVTNAPDVEPPATSATQLVESGAAKVGALPTIASVFGLPKKTGSPNDPTLAIPRL